MGYMTFHIQHISLQLCLNDAPVLVEKINITLHPDRCPSMNRYINFVVSLFMVMVYGA